MATRSRRLPPDGGGDDDEVDGGRSTSPWLWVSAGLAVLILALAGFAILQLTAGPGASPAPQVVVPNLVGKTFLEARAEALAVGLRVEQVGFEESDQPVGTVTQQDPIEGTSVDQDSVINLTMAISPQGVAVPDLRGRTEADAVNLIAAANLLVGTRSEAFDAVFPAGSVVSHEPGPNQIVVPGTVVNYVVSKGPEPTASPSPTPEPTPTPTPAPTAAPTPTPTPAPLTVGDYRCVVLALAQAQIQNDGFAVGSVTGPNDPASMVVAQNPAPNATRPPLTPIDLTVVAQPAETCPA